MIDIGTECVVSGTPLHHGHRVKVVDPRGEYARANATGRRLSGNPTTHRPGMVAAFNPAYPTTLWWWFAPHQLTPIKEINP